MSVTPAARHRFILRSLLSPLLLLCAICSADAQGPVAYYPFSGNASDMSGNGHHGTVTGARLIGDRFGNPRSAYVFDGNDYITVPHSPQLTFRIDQEFTLAAWVQSCLPQDDFAGIVAKGPNNLLRPGYQLFMLNDSLPALEISRNDGDLSRILATRSTIGTRWRFITLVVSPIDGTVRIYIDGKLDRAVGGIGIEPNLRDTEPPLYIGAERNLSVFFKGAIDDVRIYDRKLGDAEIVELFGENGWNLKSGGSGMAKVKLCPDRPLVLEAPDLLRPYNWSTGDTNRSITVTAPGRYLVEGVVATGCRRTDTFDVTVGSALTVDAGNRKRICLDSTVLLVGSVEEPGSVYSYEWFPTAGLGSPNAATTTASPRQTTTYYFRVTRPGDCGGLDSVTVMVDALPTGGAGPDVRVCAGEAVQIGLPPAPGSALLYRWIAGEGLSSTTVARPLARPTATGSYIVEIRSVAGCATLDTVVVTVIAPPRIDVGPDVRACRGTPIRIGSNATGGSGPYTYSWSPAVGLSSTTDARPLASPATPLRYIVRVTDANGCSALDSVIVTVEDLPAKGAGPDLTSCAGEQVRLGVDPIPGQNLSYRWLAGEGLLSTNVARPLVSPTTGGEYIVEISSEAGCTTRDTMVLSVRPMPRVEAGDDARICSGASVTIGASASGGSGPYSYAWSPATGLSSVSEATPIARPITSTLYFVTVTDANGCSSADSVLVEVDRLPIAGAGPDVAICPGEELQLGIDPPAGESYTYLWISGENLLSTDVARPRARPTASGAYVVRIRNSVGCETLDTMLVAMNTPPRIDAGPDRQICNQDSTRIGAEATGGLAPYSYSWSPAAGLSSTVEATPLAAPAVPTRYTVIVTDARGCRDTASVMVASFLSDITVVNLKEWGELVLAPDIEPGRSEAICDSVRLRNPGDLPMEIGSISLASNLYFSLAPGQLPFVIPPHSERALGLCYEPLTAIDRLDTLRLGDDCGIEIPLLLRTNLVLDDCGLPLAVRVVGKRTFFRAEPPFPNPTTTGEATVRIERATPSLDPLPAEECTLYSGLGVEVASGRYLPQSGWSLDGMSYERGAFTFTTDDLPAGVYHVRIRTGASITSYPLVITR